MGRGCIAGCWRSLIWIPQVSVVRICLDSVEKTSFCSNIVWAAATAAAAALLDILNFLSSFSEQVSGSSAVVFFFNLSSLIYFLNFWGYQRASVFSATYLWEAVIVKIHSCLLLKLKSQKTGTSTLNLQNWLGKEASCCFLIFSVKPVVISFSSIIAEP